MNLLYRKTLLITLLVFVAVILVIIVLVGFRPLKGSYNYTAFIKAVAEIPDYKIMSEVQYALEEKDFPLLYRLSYIIYGHKDTERFTVEGKKVISNVGNRNKDVTKKMVIQKDNKQFEVRVQVLEGRVCCILVCYTNKTQSDSMAWLRIVKEKFPLLSIRGAKN